MTITLVFTPSDAIKGKPKGDAPPGYHWGGDQWVKDRPINWPQTNPDPSGEPKNNPVKPDNDDDGGLYLYRFDIRSPDEIAKEGGFKAWGSNLSIPDHVSKKSINNKTSAYVSTSRTRAGALDLWKGRRDGYLYKIKYQVTGIDVSNQSRFPHQKEVAVPFFISATDIVGEEKFSKLK